MYGGKSLYVPTEPTPDHPLSRLIGMSAFRALTASEFRGTTIRFVPKNKVHARVERWRKVYDLLSAGRSVIFVAKEVGMSPNNVNNIRRILEHAGVLPMVFKGRDADRP